MGNDQALQVSRRGKAYLSEFNIWSLETVRLLNGNFFRAELERRDRHQAKRWDMDSGSGVIEALAPHQNFRLPGGRGGGGGLRCKVLPAARGQTLHCGRTAGKAFPRSEATDTQLPAAGWQGGVARKLSKRAGWYFRVYALVGNVRRKLSKLFFPNRWGKDFGRYELDICYSQVLLLPLGLSNATTVKSAREGVGLPGTPKPPMCWDVDVDLAQMQVNSDGGRQFCNMHETCCTPFR